MSTSPLTMLPPWLWSLVCGMLIAGWAIRGARARRALPLPPGPTPFPIFGNTSREKPASRSAREYRALANKYGGILHLTVFGRSQVVLTSHEAAADILEKQSAITSDRMQSIMFTLCGWGAFFVTKNNGPELRRHRRVFHQAFGAETIPRYRAVQKEIIHGLLRNLLLEPGQFVDHIELAIARMMLRVTYGIEIADRDDDYLKMMERVAHGGDGILAPGRFYVEVFNFLQYIPEWFPGATFKRESSRLRRDCEIMRTTLFNVGRRAASEGISRDSAIANWAEASAQMSEEALWDDAAVFQDAAGNAYIGGFDTSKISILALLLAMAIYPDVQHKAQAELDRVVGPDRLPDFTDREKLPYMQAVLKEVLRWHVTVPLGMPHCSSEEVETSGYRIPKGALITWNAWAFSRDTTDYPDPERFDPDRYLKDGMIDPTVRDPGTYVYGYGRRVCPGRHFAEAFLFTTFASLLHVFEVSPPLDAEGRPIPLEARYSEQPQIVEFPVAFDCTIKPRSSQAAALVSGSTF